MVPRKNILVYRLGSLGDTIVALPCFHLIRKAYPAAKITILTNVPVSGKAAPAMDILGNSGLCDEAISYPVGTRSISQLSTLAQTIRQIQPEVLVNLTAGRGRLKSLRDFLFFKACGIKEIVGTPMRRHHLHVLETAAGVYESESQRLASRLVALGKVDLADRHSWDLGLTKEEKARASELLPAGQTEFLAVSVGTKVPVKDWGTVNWEKLLALLSRELNSATLVLLGSSDENERSEKLGLSWTGNRVNLCGKTTPRVASAILERCRLFIGHDSGPMHLASVVGVPTLGIFSWINPPGQWFPGHNSWGNIKTIYPPLPNGVWNPGLQMKQSDSEGIGLTKPDAVLRTAMEMWRFNSNLASNPSPAWNSPSNSQAVQQKTEAVIPPVSSFTQAKAT